MKLLKQPEQTNLCGQTCVAMVAGVTIEDAAEVIGTRGRTRNKDLVKGLMDLNVSCSFKAKRGLPECETAIMKVYFGRNRHWVIWDNGHIIDPAVGHKVDAESYLLENPVVTISHIEVKNN